MLHTFVIVWDRHPFFVKVKLGNAWNNVVPSYEGH